MSVEAVLVKNDSIREKAELLVEKVYKERGWNYYKRVEPIMWAALDGEDVIGVLCARPGEQTTTEGFKKYMSGLDSPWACHLGKIVTKEHTGKAFLALLKAAYRWGDQNGFLFFWFETIPEQAEVYQRLFGFVPIGEVTTHTATGTQAVLLFSSVDNPKLKRILFKRKL